MSSKQQLLPDLGKDSGGMKINKRAVSSLRIGKKLRIGETTYVIHELSAINVINSTIQRLILDDLEPDWVNKIHVVLKSADGGKPLFQKIAVVEVINTLELVKSLK